MASETDVVSNFCSIEEAQRIANDAVASLCGLVLRRLQDEHLSRSVERNITEETIDERLSEIFGEALQQFSA